MEHLFRIVGEACWRASGNDDFGEALRQVLLDRAAPKDLDFLRKKGLIWNDTQE